MLRMCAPYRFSKQVMGSKHLCSELSPCLSIMPLFKIRWRWGGGPPHISHIEVGHYT